MARTLSLRWSIVFFRQCHLCGKQKKVILRLKVNRNALIADETVSDNPEQYKLLKQYAGMKYVPVNKKYLPKYMAQNNMNIIILSNSAIPIYVARDEKPT